MGKNNQNMEKYIIFFICILFILIAPSVFAEDPYQAIAEEAVSIIKKYEKAYSNKNLDEMTKYVNQDSEWFKKGFIDEFKAIFKTFSNINLYHFKRSEETSIYHAYPSSDGILIGQNTLYIAYSRSLSDLNEFTEVYFVKKIDDNYKIDAVTHMPGKDVEFIDKGTQAILNNQPDEAIDYFKKALDANPENSVAHCRLGMIYSKTGKNKEALSEIKRATELRPNVAFYKFYLSQIHFIVGDKEKAGKEMKEALILDPGLNIFFENNP